MAAKVLTDAYFSLNGNDLSTYVKSLTFNREREAQDDTTMGMTTHSNLPGLINWGLQVEFRADYADNLLCEILDTAFTAGVVALAIRASKTDAISANNPEWQAQGFITSEQILGGGVGELAKSPITIVPGGGANAAIVRDITP